MITMKQYAEIRRRHTQGESLRVIARCLGISRNTVRKYCRGETLPERGRRRQRELAPETLRLLEYVRECLEQEERDQAGRQKHTARRLHERARHEIGYRGSYTTVLKVWHLIRSDSGRCRGFLQLEHEAGAQLQVDFAQVWIGLCGVKTMIYLFVAVLPCSGRFIAFAYRVKDRGTFLDGVYRALQHFGGVPAAVVFDNDAVAVRRGTGAHALPQEQYASLAAHCCFEPVFCNPGSGHEKGCVERMVRYVREHAMVSMPQVTALTEVDELLAACAARHEQECSRGCALTRLQRFETEEAPALRPLPPARFETAWSQEAAVSSEGLVTWQTCRYSVPLEYAGCSVTLRVHPERVELYSNERGEWDEHGRQRLLAVHRRRFARHESSQYLAHVLTRLLNCPRALLSSAAAVQAMSREERARLLACTDRRQLRETLEGYARRQLEQAGSRDTITTSTPGPAVTGREQAAGLPQPQDAVRQGTAEGTALRRYTALYAAVPDQEARHAGRT